jgi:phage tail-like protein
MSLDALPKPSAGYRFGVEIQGLVVGWFTECSGLSFERTVVPHEEGGVNDRVHQLPGRIKRASLSLKHGLADSKLMDWFVEGQHDGKAVRRDVSIVLFSKWQGSGPISGSDQVAVETIEIGGDDDNVGLTAVQRAAGQLPGETEEDGGGEVDLAALARRIVGLLKQDLRLERERLPRTDGYWQKRW